LLSEKKRTRRLMVKRYSIVLTAIAIMIAISIPLFAHGPWGGHEGGNPDNPRYEMGSGNFWCPHYNLQNEKLSEAQRTQLMQINEKYTKDTATMRKQLQEKRQEMRSLLDSPNPDETKILDLQKQTARLRDQLDQEWIKYNLNIKKIAPDAKIGQAWRNGYHGRMTSGMPLGRCHGYNESDQG
jgi:Spy/CpxP family protein refolding chaperone